MAAYFAGLYGECRTVVVDGEGPLSINVASVPIVCRNDWAAGEHNLCLSINKQIGKDEYRNRPRQSDNEYKDQLPDDFEYPHSPVTIKGCPMCGTFQRPMRCA